MDTRSKSPSRSAERESGIHIAIRAANFSIIPEERACIWRWRFSCARLTQKSDKHEQAIFHLGEDGLSFRISLGDQGLDR
ncbi:MAG: hypothetical protein AB8I69_04830, partial [Anaerolineae bacterium]